MSWTASASGTDKEIVRDKLSHSLSMVPSQTVGGVTPELVTALSLLVACTPMLGQLSPGVTQTVTVAEEMQAAGTKLVVTISTMKAGT